MKPYSMHPRMARAGAFAVLVSGALSLPLHAQVIDPDPDLFDGTRTKEQAIEEQEQPTVDDWEDANLIVYDSNEQGSRKGGQGRVGYENPGSDLGSPSGGGMSMGLPLPMGGGGGGIGQSGLEIPEMPNPMGGGGGEESAEQKDAAGSGNPEGTEAGRGAQAGGGKQPPQKPGDVAIGDASKRIQSAAAVLGDTSGLEKSADDTKGDGGDDTQMKAASGAQSGRRGGGVEKGDAIPTDL